MKKNAILEEFERHFGEDFAKFIIRSIRDFPKAFEIPIRSIEDFEKMVRTLPCLGRPQPITDEQPRSMNVRYKPMPCPHCKALKMVEKLKHGN